MAPMEFRRRPGDEMQAHFRAPPAVVWRKMSAAAATVWSRQQTPPAVCSFFGLPCSFSSLGRRTPASSPDIIIPATYGALHSGPSAGTIVGITLGSVAAFILLVWLLYACFNYGYPGGGGPVFEASTRETTTVRDAESFASASLAERHRRRRRRSGGGGHGHRHGHASRNRRSSGSHHHHSRRLPVIVDPPGRPHRVVVEEEVRRRQQQRRGDASTVRSSTTSDDEVVVLEEDDGEAGRRRRRPQRVAVTDEEGEDEVVVIEEHSPARPPTQHSRRSSRR